MHACTPAPAVPIVRTNMKNSTSHAGRKQCRKGNLPRTSSCLCSPPSTILKCRLARRGYVQAQMILQPPAPGLLGPAPCWMLAPSFPPVALTLKSLGQCRKPRPPTEIQPDLAAKPLSYQIRMLDDGYTSPETRRKSLLQGQGLAAASAHSRTTRCSGSSESWGRLRVLVATEVKAHPYSH